jgi:hypothetical protein
MRARGGRALTATLTATATAHRPAVMGLGVRLVGAGLLDIAGMPEPDLAPRLAL